MRLIGRRCKCSNACSWPILIGRGLILKRFENQSKLRNIPSEHTKRASWEKPWTLLKRYYAVVNLQWRFKDYLKCILSTWKSCYISIAVTIALRSHLFSFRTQKLSSIAPKVLSWQRLGRIGSCRISFYLAVFFQSDNFFKSLINGAILRFCKVYLTWMTTKVYPIQLNFASLVLLVSKSFKRLDKGGLF